MEHLVFETQIGELVFSCSCIESLIAIGHIAWTIGNLVRALIIVIDIPHLVSISFM